MWLPVNHIAMKKICWLLFIGLLLTACSKDEATPLDAGDGGSENPNPIPPPDNPSPGLTLPKDFTPCIDGMAGPFPCSGYDLLGRLAPDDFAAARGNDIWGWTDAQTSREYALVGLNNGTAFVDITNSDALVYLGKLPTTTNSSNWRDIKVYQDHAYIVSEAAGHGMQVFDLTQLRDVAEPPQSFVSDAWYTGFGNAHNIVINESTGFAYVVGTARNDQFNGGVHFLDLSDPKNPVAAGGYGGSGYTHDAQVVVYNGPDPDYAGREILIGANESRVVLVDVTSKDFPQLITDLGYANTGYTHQGWFTEDQRYFILGDETDEINFGFDSRTLIFDFSDLDNPVLHHTYLGASPAIDHNGYVFGDQFFLANYTAGMRRLDISQIGGQIVTEAAFFDSFPAHNNPAFSGVWSVYPYFASGKLLLNDINSGLFVIEASSQP